MAAIFDTLAYTKGAEVVGIKREHAEYQAQQMAKMISETVATKIDVKSSESALRSDIEKMEFALRSDMEKVESSLRSDMSVIRNDMTRIEMGLKQEIKSIEVTMIKWAIGIAFTQMGLFMGILSFMLRH